MIFPIQSRVQSGTSPQTLPSSPEPEQTRSTLRTPTAQDRLTGSHASHGMLEAPATGFGLRTPQAAAVQPTTVTPVQASAADANLPTNRSLTRLDFQNPDLVRYVGAAMGQAHRSSLSDAHGQTPLRLIADVDSRMRNVEQSDSKSRACPMDIDSAKALVAALSRDLQAAAQTRVYGDFNAYPEALQIDGQGHYTNTPGHKHTGWHADFEILTRLDYTARLNHAGLDMMLDAYYEARDQKAVTPAQRAAAYKAKYLFDILYCFYFIDIAYTQPEAGKNLEFNQPESLKQAALLRTRLLEDAQTDVGVTLPALQFKDA